MLTGSLAFAGFVLAAETYRSYKEKEETEGKQEEVKVGTYSKVGRKSHDSHHILHIQKWGEKVMIAIIFFIFKSGEKKSR